MQFEDFDYEESVTCNCQLLQTVQHLVNKYRSVINTESSSQIDRYENRSSRPSTVCGADSSAMLKALPSPLFAPSELSSRLSAHVPNGHQATANLAIRRECRSVDELSREESSVACRSPATHSPVRIVRLPNRMCPVHSLIDEHYFNSTGSALELNYDTISVTNCWQGLKFTSPSSASASGSSKVAPASLAVSSLRFDNARMFGKFLQPFWSYGSWALIVSICGAIVYFCTRESE